MSDDIKFEGLTLEEEKEILRGSIDQARSSIERVSEVHGPESVEFIGLALDIISLALPLMTTVDQVMYAERWITAESLCTYELIHGIGSIEFISKQNDVPADENVHSTTSIAYLQIVLSDAESIAAAFEQHKPDSFSRAKAADIRRAANELRMAIDSNVDYVIEQKLNALEDELCKGRA